ncbi:hypothetical protein [Galbibacter pacificus]|uniref:Uncharacterized protein n=1 Tax=Galbibacter pacificus TaxID=2996052 RepID=A0ABT6FP45_9FLAO|nr:hypothetical protein [Galbibacter pacificus]MDG3581564.1 hypothetical protein [Galbibacter pacificus]MDG3585042.1 hypothetical protein [Galbibacter pacificus]
MIRLLYYMLLLLFNLLGGKLQQKEKPMAVQKEKITSVSRAVCISEKIKKEKLSLTLNSF